MGFEATVEARSLPTRLDRYPAKMVSRLAERLVEQYASGAGSLLDPFCGSGAIIGAAQRKGIPVTGVDINPYAVLLSSVKTRAFSAKKAEQLCYALLAKAKMSSEILPIRWQAKGYWFSPATIDKYERLRYAAREMGLNSSTTGRVVLLALALSVRLCSRADQRSPKPFISRKASQERRGRHFCPYTSIEGLLHDLCRLHAVPRRPASSTVVMLDVRDESVGVADIGLHTHVVTSPPYINAQDYFRNFKLELYILEGPLPFSVDALKGRFVGTERGDLTHGIREAEMEGHCQLLPELRCLHKSSRRHALVVHRYLSDMGKAFDTISRVLQPHGTCVVVCGDNLIGGSHICTWKVLNALLEQRGFELFDSFSDPITRRMLPPQRCGHKGLVKEERVSAFRMGRSGVYAPTPGQPMK